MGSLDLSLSSLIGALLLLLIPLCVSVFYRLGLVRQILFGTFRMVVQLILVGFFLTFLFEKNEPMLNVVWLIVMVTAAVFSAISATRLNVWKILLPTFVSFCIATFAVVFYLNTFVLRLDHVFDARFLIVLGGMVLGNALRGNIIGIGTFYNDIKKDYKNYLYVLSLGATHLEALAPYMRDAIQKALQPTLAAMATMGLVALPGMMTGVILGGVDPTIAIKYQIMIMFGILSATTVSVVLTILTTVRVSFSPCGMLQDDIFNKSKNI